MNARRRSIRLKGFDYSRCGSYFVTVCVQGRVRLFGECANGRFQPKASGRMIQAIWNELPGRFPNVSLDEFVGCPTTFTASSQSNRTTNRPITTTRTIMDIRTITGLRATMGAQSITRINTITSIRAIMSMGAITRIAPTE